MPRQLRLNQVKLLIALLFTHFISPAQDYTGVWNGHLQTLSSNAKFELAITIENGNIKGYALTSFIYNGVENIGIKSIEIKQKKNILLLEDHKLLYDNFSSDARRVKFYASLTFDKNSIETLVGTFSTRSLDLRSRDSYAGTILLQKQHIAIGSKLLAKLEELNLTDKLSFIQTEKMHKTDSISNNEKVIAKSNIEDKMNASDNSNLNSPIHQKIMANGQESASVSSLFIKSKITSINYTGQGNKETTYKNSKVQKQIAQVNSTILKITNSTFRKTEIIEEIFYDSDTLLLSLFDNGEVDGDSVSIFVNNNVVINKQKLSTLPIKAAISLIPFEDTFYLIMHAENLGIIPPNTGLLVLQLGTLRREIRFSCDLQKNAGLLLRRKRG